MASTLSAFEKECLNDLKTSDIKVYVTPLMESAGFCAVRLQDLNSTDAFFIAERQKLTKPNQVFPSGEPITYQSEDGDLLVYVHQLERIGKYVNSMPQFRTFVMQYRFDFGHLQGSTFERVSRFVPSNAAISSFGSALQTSIDEKVGVYLANDFKTNEGFSLPDQFTSPRLREMYAPDLPPDLKINQLYFSLMLEYVPQEGKVPLQGNDKESAAQAVAKSMTAITNLLNIYIRGERSAYVNQINARNDILEGDNLMAAALLPLRK